MESKTLLLSYIVEILFHLIAQRLFSNSTGYISCYFRILFYFTVYKSLMHTYNRKKIVLLFLSEGKVQTTELCRYGFAITRRGDKKPPSKRVRVCVMALPCLVLDVSGIRKLLHVAVRSESHGIPEYA